MSKGKTSYTFAACLTDNKGVIMKKKILMFLFVSMGLTSYIVADSIPIQGQWDERGVRSILPTPPSASVEDNIISIYFTDIVTNLMVKIYDESGGEIYSERVSGGRNFTYILPCALDAGNYQIVMSHLRYGSLKGEFSIE